jgi:uncharacterized Zn finger protein (UPF0148 family)
MSSLKKNCHECGMPLSLGVASCPHCGASVGTLFDEAAVPPAAPKSKSRRKVGDTISYHQQVETAQERANNSVILGLASFFCPGIGFFMGVAAITLSVLAARTLKTHNVEDGRGSATAGLIIGVLGLIAQGGYVVYVIKSGKLPFVG